MKRTVALTLGLAIALVATGCASSVIASRFDTTDRGLAYLLPKGAFLVTLTVTKKKTGFETKLELVPTRTGDPSEIFFLSHETNTFAHDEVALAVNERGLLTSVKTIADDETPEVVATVGEIAANVAKLAMGFPPTGGLESLGETRTLDQELEKLLGKHQFLVDAARISTLPLPGGSSTLSVSVARPSHPQANRCDSPGQPPCPKMDGVRYRIPLPVNVTATLQVDYGASTPYIVKTALATTIPDESSTHVLAFDRAPFVTVKRNATFSDGMLVGLEIDRPSPALGFLAIPLDLIERVVALPSELLTIQVKSAQDQATLLKSQVEIAEQLATLEALSQAEQQAQESNP